MESILTFLKTFVSLVWQGLVIAVNFLKNFISKFWKVILSAKELFITAKLLKSTLVITVFPENELYNAPLDVIETIPLKSIFVTFIYELVIKVELSPK